ncbi:hypothetical protein [Dysosmobacter sp. HCP28S3_G4]|uniref:hypothetical protein n=1 Tax=Dysosmobacter sp. HCP28S3_G4 TaxID=3438938 RepID=UPI003F109A46|nr:hypothetical protein [Dysosmobacter sp.]
MKWIIAALVLGIFLNLSTASGTSWPIGSVVAVVIMGIYIKISQDRHFEELKGILEKETAPDNMNAPASKDRTDMEQ